jgi:hypothetical protein
MRVKKEGTANGSEVREQREGDSAAFHKTRATKTRLKVNNALGVENVVEIDFKTRASAN